MNPLPIAVLLLISQGQGGINGRGRRGRGAGGLLSAGADFDVAPVLDGLYRTANALERIDKMNKLARLPMTRERAPELLEAIGAPPEVKNLIQAGQRAYGAWSAGRKRALRLWQCSRIGGNSRIWKYGLSGAACTSTGRTI